jgi:uncharacterized Fe-S cluster protein YjdI
VKHYEGERVEVTYDTQRCLHAAECVRGLPAVFDTAKRPWVEPDAATAEAVADTVQRCPTGALHYALREGEPERPRVPTRVRLPDGGPLLLEGNLELDGQRETRAALCRCDKSGNPPYCDHSGTCEAWEYGPLS